MPPLVHAQPEADDARLFQSALAGDAPALAELVRRYWPGLAAYAARLLDGNRDAGQDIAQEVFLRIWQRRIRWRPTGSVRTFLYALARNLCLNHRRSLRIRLCARDRVRALLRDWQRTPTPLELIEQADERAAVERAIAQLPARRREVFLLVRVHGLSYREVAELLRISPQTVANQMSAALAQLRMLL